MSSHYLGLDLGGTNVKAGITDATGKLVAQVSVPTGSGGRDLAPDKVIARMIDAGEQVITNARLTKQHVKSVGVLAPGQASLAKGIILRSANLPLWKNVHLRAKVSLGLGLPAIPENDANAPAYGEWGAGAGKRGGGGQK
ncbi:MAG: ROK family protein [Phycisphaerales bacterium]|nr:ROK family protein [Phycisphaerales bacterium]